jgi:hypothetical protein
VPAESLEEWLKGAAHQAAQEGALDLDLADSRGTLDLLGGRGSDETDLNPLQG